MPGRRRSGEAAGSSRVRGGEPDARHGAAPTPSGWARPRAGASSYGAPRRRTSEARSRRRTTRRPSVAPGPYVYSPGTWLWWTSAAVSAPCQPLGNEDPRAPHPHCHCHLPRPSQWTTGWWLRRAVRRRRVLMDTSLERWCHGSGTSARDGPMVGQVCRDGGCRLGRSADHATVGGPCRWERVRDARAALRPVAMRRPRRWPVRRCADDRPPPRPRAPTAAGHPAARVGRAGGTGRDVVRLLGCVQSQDAPLAAWSLGMRMGPGTTYADVLAEQAAGGWVRTHVLRPTWHLLAPEDLRWMQGVTGPRVEGAMAGVNARLGLTAEVVAAALRVLESLLAGPTPHTRREVRGGVRRGRAAHRGAAPGAPADHRRGARRSSAPGRRAAPSTPTCSSTRWCRPGRTTSSSRRTPGAS